jgi:putative alpha-1,2-mannosidase
MQVDSKFIRKFLFRKVGISFISWDQARANLDGQTTGRTFQEILQTTQVEKKIL